MSESLQQLEEQERAISRERRQLHLRIEYLSGTGAHDADAPALLAELIVQERDVSRRRKELHGLIDRVRADRVEQAGPPEIRSDPIETTISPEPERPLSWFERDEYS